LRHKVRNGIFAATVLGSNCDCASQDCPQECGGGKATAPRGLPAHIRPIAHPAEHARAPEAPRLARPAPHAAGKSPIAVVVSTPVPTSAPQPTKPVATAAPQVTVPPVPHVTMPAPAAPAAGDHGITVRNVNLLDRSAGGGSLDAQSLVADAANLVRQSVSNGDAASAGGAAPAANPVMTATNATAIGGNATVSVGRECV
jgi:hypothetical protein